MDRDGEWVRRAAGVGAGRATAAVHKTGSRAYAAAPPRLMGTQDASQIQPDYVASSGARIKTMSSVLGRKESVSDGQMRAISSRRGLVAGVGGGMSAPRQSGYGRTNPALLEDASLSMDEVYTRRGHHQPPAPFSRTYGMGTDGTYNDSTSICEVAATPPALANASPRQVPAGYASYQDPSIDLTTFVQWSVGQWRVYLPRSLGRARSRAIISKLLTHGVYAAGLARVGDALVPAALTPANRYTLAQNVRLSECGAQAWLAGDESAS